MSKTALVVDDSKSARFALRKFLEGFNYKVEVAEDAHEACRKLVDLRPDVIFMDHIMPGIDGFGALRMLKADPHTSAIPVLLCSSNEGEDFCAQAKACGAIGVLQKPPSPQQLAQALASLANANGVMPSASEGGSSPAVATAATATREPSPMERLMATIAPKPNVETPIEPAAGPQPVEAIKPALALPLPIAAHTPSTPSKVQSLREPAVTIQQAVMKSLRDAMPAEPAPEPTRAPGPSLPAMHPLTSGGDTASALLSLREEMDTRLRALRQEIAAEFSALNAQLAGFDSNTLDETLRSVATEISRTHTSALAANLEQHLATLHANLDGILHAQNERIEQLLQNSRQTAAEEAERTVMNAAQRIADQMAESIIKTLGPQISNMRRL